MPLNLWQTDNLQSDDKADPTTLTTIEHKRCLITITTSKHPLQNYFHTESLMHISLQTHAHTNVQFHAQKPRKLKNVKHEKHLERPTGKTSPYDPEF